MLFRSDYVITLKSFVPGTSLAVPQPLKSCVLEAFELKLKNLPGATDPS